MPSDIEQYRERIGQYLGLPSGHVTLFWKGRVAFYAILEALGIGPRDEVILPAFTCVVVPNAILYRGATPVYADIERATFHVDLARLEALITPRTRALIAQNTFGLAPPLDELREIARRRRLRLIEDCAHGLGGTYKGRKNGTLAEASFFSTQWNKPFSTGLGGIAVTPDPQIAAALRAIENRAISPSTGEAAMLALLLQARRVFARPEAFATAARIYRALGRRRLVVGSSDVEETAGSEEPKGFLKRSSPLQARAGMRGLAKLDGYTRHRRAIAAIYAEALERAGVPRVFEPPGALHTFLKYPFLVARRDEVLAAAAAQGIALSDWFRSPLHPVDAGWDRWGYIEGSNPVAEEISSQMVNLPTQPGVTPGYARRVIEFLESLRGSS